jgi:hypothetical protein
MLLATRLTFNETLKPNFGPTASFTQRAFQKREQLGGGNQGDRMSLRKIAQNVAQPGFGQNQ